MHILRKELKLLSLSYRRLQVNQTSNVSCGQQPWLRHSDVQSTTFCSSLTHLRPQTTVNKRAYIFNVDLCAEETQEMCLQWQLHKESSADTCITFKYQQQLQSRGNAWGWGTFVSHVCCQHEHTQMQGHSHWHIHTAGLCLPHAADKPQLFSLPPSLFAHCLLPFVALHWPLFDANS